MTRPLPDFNPKTREFYILNPWGTVDTTIDIPDMKELIKIVLRHSPETVVDAWIDNANINQIMEKKSKEHQEYSAKWLSVHRPELLEELGWVKKDG